MRVFACNSKRIYTIFTLLIFLVIQLSACSSVIGAMPISDDSEYPKAEVVFQANLPEPLKEGTKLVLEILDDVTGVYFNSSRLEMAQKDEKNYFIRVPLTISSEVKYRYVAIGTSSQYEYSSQNQQVRFRIIRINGPDLVQDLITTWIDQPYSGPMGRIRGQIVDQENNAPIPNLLICAGGLQTISAADGTFILEGLTPGIHNVVIYSMDGMYDTFQQGALISEEATTPVLAFLSKRRTREITINVEIPDGYDENLPLRFVSNLQSLGNAYADLQSGSTGSSVNYPVLESNSNGHYKLKLTLPVGLFLRYKYSFGDGFWNSELDESGNFVVRELIVDNAGSINDSVNTFTVENFQPINFIAHAPSDTPATDTIFLQFNPFGWMEPIQMTSGGENTWKYSLYSPLHMLGTITYRFCRNGQCETGGEMNAPERQISPRNQPQTIEETIPGWRNVTSSLPPFSLVTEGGPSQPNMDFIAGIELSPDYTPSWQVSIDRGLAAASEMGSDWVILTPTWSVTRINPPLFEPTAGKDLLWNELENLNSHVELNNQKSILFPSLTYAQTSDIFWMTANRDLVWWNTWFERYQTFMLNYADFASVHKIDAIIVGDSSLAPAMPGGKLPNGSDSSAPADADARWRQLIINIRSRFSGKIFGVASINSDEDWVPGWLEDVDAIYVLLSPSLAESNSASVSDFKQEFTGNLKNRVYPIYKKYKKPIIIGLAYPSNGYAIGGYPLLNNNRITSPGEVIEITPDLEIQAKIYNAAIISLAANEWVTGFISRGYYPYVALQDASSTIYGKPAADVLWFWFHFILNKTP